MQKKEPIREADIRDFRAGILQFGPGSEAAKLHLLQQFPGRPIGTGRTLVAYHDALLLAEAYAPDAACLALVRQELIRLSEIAARWWKSKDDRKKYALSGSGVAHSLLVGSFSYELTRWLQERFPESVRLEGQTASEIPFQDLLARALHPSELALQDARKHALKPWLGRAFASGDPLAHLIRLIGQLPASQELRDLFFDNQKIYLQALLDDPAISRTFGRFLPEQFHFQDSLIRNVDLPTEAIRALPAPLKLTDAQRQALWTNARAILFTLFRETDPVTFTQPEHIRWQAVGRGVGIALFELRRDRRLPLDSYIGYVAYKNGIPQAYGGCWIFRDQAKIGINVFPAFRGGESSWLFAQLIRTYARTYGIRAFAVEPYQIGKNNPEGIASGAFWFYYRHGFRPLQQDLSQLAETESARITDDRQYKSSARTLRRLAESDLLLSLDEKPIHPFPARYSEWMTRQFAGNFQGNRTIYVKEAIKFCRAQQLLNGKKPNEQAARSLELLAPLVMAVLSKSSPLKAGERAALAHWLTARYSGTEADWLRATRRCAGFFRRLDALVD